MSHHVLFYTSGKKEAMLHFNSIFFWYIDAKETKKQPQKTILAVKSWNPPI